MNITLIGSINDTYSRMTHQWFVDNDIQGEYVEVDVIPPEFIEAGVTSLPIVMLNGRIHCTGYDLQYLELLTHL